MPCDVFRKGLRRFSISAKAYRVNCKDGLDSSLEDLQDECWLLTELKRDETLAVESFWKKWKSLTTGIMLSAGGRADSAVVARAKCLWRKFT